ncbi:hypothetical protein SEVIR_7G080067v4 [Setaria viridis]
MGAAGQSPTVAAAAGAEDGRRYHHTPPVLPDPGETSSRWAILPRRRPPSCRSGFRRWRDVGGGRWGGGGGIWGPPVSLLRSDAGDGSDASYYSQVRWNRPMDCFLFTVAMCYAKKGKGALICRMH